MKIDKEFDELDTTDHKEILSPDTELKLIIELVPSTVWRSSIYRKYETVHWRNIKMYILANNGHLFFSF